MEKIDKYWDPIGEKIKQDDYFFQTMPLLQKAEGYKKNPYRIRRNRDLLIIFPIIFIIILIAKFGTGDIFNIVLFSFTPLLIYLGMIYSFQQNFILYLMCFENDWIYAPEKDSSRFERLKNAYPMIFNQGHSQTIEDQIWGAVGEKKIDSFWTCSFTFTTGSGKHRRTHDHSIFMLRMYKKLPLDFCINKKGLISILSNGYKTESEEFNNLFDIKIENEKSDTKLLLLKILSPSVQVRLIELANEFPLDKIGFYGDTMILDFKEHIWNPKYTNFFNKVEVDDRDKTLFLSQIKTMTTTPIEVLQFID